MPFLRFRSPAANEDLVVCRRSACSRRARTTVTGRRARTGSALAAGERELRKGMPRGQTARPATVAAD